MSNHERFPWGYVDEDNFAKVIFGEKPVESVV